MIVPPWIRVKASARLRPRPHTRCGAALFTPVEAVEDVGAGRHPPRRGPYRRLPRSRQPPCPASARVTRPPEGVYLRALSRRFANTLVSFLRSQGRRIGFAAPRTSRVISFSSAEGWNRSARSAMRPARSVSSLSAFTSPVSALRDIEHGIDEIQEAVAFLDDEALPWRRAHPRLLRRRGPSPPRPAFS